ncbi:FIST signal transduction protein [Paracoccus shanxieyensis]|uniref:GfdT protein n=1 Tax=Paracoccus shanxieyensis TaxID=2675752 RepID=A0A6L6J0S8_9RHOB|nr:FIST N-terminal domain-containing protein [Paracoccus shanxieyensis]MTH64277.1 GfdT protein [Paracoccus shanxieyensis]MTH87421.1 GfdT protein [Paracoccus shanxieyensis]
MTASPPPIARACAPADAADALAQLRRGLGAGPFALVLLFISAEADLSRLAREASAAFPARHVIGCTTAGEISQDGYDQGSIVAFGFADGPFAAECLLVPDLSHLSRQVLTQELLQTRQRLADDHAGLPSEFAVLLVDGMSVREDELAAALAVGAGTMPLIGGSAGDGIRFRETWLLHDGRLLRDAAVLCVLRSAGPVRPINIDHLQPTELRMVVTRADPASRTVQCINAEPAAQEYARLLGKDPMHLDAFTFAAHPLAVRIGKRHHVRAIQRALPSGELVFFSAIDNGVVLTMTQPGHLDQHLEAELQRLSAPGKPDAILAFDCILRRIEAQEKQMTGRISALMRSHGVTGFSTYGEQFGPMHVNHTLTGYAFYPPGTDIGPDPA